MKRADKKAAKRFVKQDYRNLAFLCVAYIAAVMIYTRFTYAFGSDIDWSAQHYAFPDYFRKLFYSTGQFFPSFAPNLGAGENIYLLSYYGLYSPIILFSYLLPFVKMADYIQYSSMFLTFLSGVLFYRFLRRNKRRFFVEGSETLEGKSVGFLKSGQSDDKNVYGEVPGGCENDNKDEGVSRDSFFSCFGPGMSLCLTIAYFIAAPVFYHSHRHIMFVNYLPFLILSLEAVENWLENRKKWTLSLCAAMIILCSWFFSVSALVAVLVYAVYRWLSVNSFDIKKFLKDGLCFAGRLFIAVMMAGVLLLPTLSALLSGRSKANIMVGLTDFIPRASLEYLAFSPYSLGMGVFAAVTIIYFLMCKNTARRFLGVALSFCIFFPLTVFILNGTLYFDAKVMIPFIPIVVIACGEVLRDMKAWGAAVLKYRTAVNGEKVLIDSELKESEENPDNMGRKFTEEKEAAENHGAPLGCNGKKITEEKDAGRRFQLASCIALCLVLTSFLYNFPFYAKLALLADGVIFELFYILFKRKNKVIYLVAMVLVFPALAMVPINLSDTATSLARLRDFTREDYAALSDVIEGQEGIWRASIAEDRKYTVNYIPTTAFYGSYLYSSTHHQAYNDFYFNVMNNENEYRNSALMTRSQNLFFESFIGNRYLISEKKDTPYGYEKLAESGSVTLYENRKALPIGRTAEVIDAEEFEKLNNPEKMVALCCYAVRGELSGKWKKRIPAKKSGKTDGAGKEAEKDEGTESLSENGSQDGAGKEAEKGSISLIKEKVKYIGTIELPENEHIKKSERGFRIDTKEEFALSYELPCEIPEGNLLIVECRVDNGGKRRMDAKIDINGVKNNLTNPKWRYYNNNTEFTFVLPPDRKLNMVFSMGDYKVEDFKVYTADYESCMNSETDSFIPDKSKTGGDVIAGSIDCRKDAYFVLTVPFDKGFEITVDGKEQEYECVDSAFIGFEMKEGLHELKLVYHAPWLRAGKWCSFFGLIIFILLIIAECFEKLLTPLKKKNIKLN